VKTVEEQQKSAQTHVNVRKPKVVLACKVEAETHAKWLGIAQMRRLTPSQMLRKAIDRELDTSNNPV